MIWKFKNGLGKEKVYFDKDEVLKFLLFYEYTRGIYDEQINRRAKTTHSK